MPWVLMPLFPLSENVCLFSSDYLELTPDSR
jgi:hypothetical protein